MRKSFAFAAALLAALVLALAACSGGGPPPAATPEATPTAEAPSTPAPTAEASPPPSPAPVATPEPPPAVACANGVAVEEPETRPGLVADCVALLTSRDVLRGEATLDWGGGLAIGRWEGVAVEGEPPRVVRLDLRDKGLTGSIPRTLRRLPLDEVRLAGNALTGCVPSAFGDARGDALYLGLPWCLRYALDATGEVAEAGGWAILGADGAVLATWEGLRSEAATLRVHQTDAAGTSWAPEFGVVSEGDLFEWRKASDCWVRYHVTGPPVRPSAGSGRWEFPVEWRAYAATGEGCKGAVASGAVLRADEDAPTTVSTANIASPVRQGPFLIRPLDWDGEREQATHHPEPPAATGGASGSSSEPAWVQATNAADAKRLFRYWKDPALPSGWTLLRATQDPSGVDGPVPDGHCAVYRTADGYLAVDTCVGYIEYRPFSVRPWWTDGSMVYELRIIDGHDTLIAYSPPGPAYNRYFGVEVHVSDKRSGIVYSVYGGHISLRGDNVDAVIAIALSLILPDGAP